MPDTDDPARTACSTRSALFHGPDASGATASARRCRGRASRARASPRRRRAVAAVRRPAAAQRRRPARRSGLDAAPRARPDRAAARAEDLRGGAYATLAAPDGRVGLAARRAHRRRAQPLRRRRDGRRPRGRVAIAHRSRPRRRGGRRRRSRSGRGRASCSSPDRRGVESRPGPLWAPGRMAGCRACASACSPAAATAPASTR